MLQLWAELTEAAACAAQNNSSHQEVLSAKHLNPKRHKPVCDLGAAVQTQQLDVPAVLSKTPAQKRRV